jgi:hypothetical protein
VPRHCGHARVARAAASALAALLAGGCAGSGALTRTRTQQHTTSARDGALPADYVPVGVGRGPRYRPPARPAAVRAGRPVDGMRCLAAAGTRYGAHLEIFSDRHVVAIPTGLGARPPFTRAAGRIEHARCLYPAATSDPSGVLTISTARPVTLGEVFDLWGQPLSRRAVATFRGPVVAYVGTRRWRGDPRAIRLARHTRVVLELASRIPPHRTYVFPPGL